MIKRQRKAILFVLLACLVVLTCTAQRMAGMHALVMNLTADSPSLQQNQDQAEAPVTPCELSAKSLMAVPPMLFEGALLAITLLLAVLAAIPPAYRTPVASPRYLLTPIAGASAIMRLP